MKQKASSWQMEKSYRETKANSDNVKDMNSAYFGVVEMIHTSPSQSQQVTFIRKKTHKHTSIPIFNKSVWALNAGWQVNNCYVMTEKGSFLDNCNQILSY